MIILDYAETLQSKHQGALETPSQLVVSISHEANGFLRHKWIYTQGVKVVATGAF